MYKRRKKPLLPQASSTLLGLTNASQVSTNSSTGSIISNSNSPSKGLETTVISSISSKRISEVPKVINSTTVVSDTTSREDDSHPVVDKENVINAKSQVSQSPASRKRQMASQVLEMLTSPSSAQKSSRILSQQFAEPRKFLNYMEEIVSNAGMDLTHNPGHNVLRKPQAVFSRDVAKALNVTKDKKRSVERFFNELKHYLSEKEIFKAALSTTKTDVDANVAGSEDQDSLIRLLLSVDSLQSHITDYLLERLGEFILTLENKECEEGMMWVRLILQPLRYLHRLIDPGAIVQKLFDIIHSTPIVMLQHEIINCIPDIMGDDQKNDVSKELIELMKHEPALTPPILVALSNMCLEGDCLYDLQLSLIRSLRRTPPQQILSFIKIIVNATNNNNLDEIFNGLRSELVICQTRDALSQSQSVKSSDISSTLVLIFDKIKDILVMNKKLGDAWLKNIGKVKSHKYHKPIDLIIILILLSITTDSTRKRAIKNLVKTRIKSGFFQTSLIDETMAVGISLLENYFGELVKLLSSLLAVNDSSVLKFAFHFYAECFTKLGSLCARQIFIEIVENVQGNLKNAKTTLKLLHYLTEHHTSKVAPHANRIMLLLDLTSDLKVNEVRQLTDTICILAFGDPETSDMDTNAFQDELFMIAQKQLGCPDPRPEDACLSGETLPRIKNLKENDGVFGNLKQPKQLIQPSILPREEQPTQYVVIEYRGFLWLTLNCFLTFCSSTFIFRSGIINAITIIKHLVNLKEGVANETPSSMTEDSIILSRQAERAYNLLEMVQTGAQQAPEAYILMYDQLSYAIMNCPNMDKVFAKKVSFLMQGTLQNYIIASSSFKPNKDALESSLQYCLDDDLEDPIALNIAGVVIEENKKNSNSSITIRTVALPGLVRVVRGLELSDLSEIDALLGCAIAFPNPNIYAKFSSIEPYVQKLALDCAFHTCNWIRETVNSFVYLVKEDCPEKILMRIRGIVQLQNIIASCLPQAISYSPPNYYFDKKSTSSEKALKRAPVQRKRKRKSDKEKEKRAREEDDEENSADESVTLNSEDEIEDEVISVEFSIFQQHLKEFDFDVFLVLTQPLVLTPEPPNGSKLSAEFGPSELMLLLDDLNSKLKYCLTEKKSFLTKQDPVGFDNLSCVPIDLIIRNTTKLINHIINHLQKIVEYLHNLKEINDGVLDAPGMFPPGSSELKKCMALIFSVFNIYFGWSELKSDAYIKCLLKAAMKLGGQAVEKNKEVSINSTLQSAINYLKTISSCMMDLTSAVNLVVLIDTLRRLQDENEDDNMDIEIATICESFLKRRWYDFKGNETKGSIINQQQSKLLEIYFAEGNAENISGTLAWLKTEVSELTDSLTTFPYFNKNNLNIIIRTICKSLTDTTKKRLENKEYKEQLEVWDSTVSCLQDLVVVVKAQDSKLNLRHFLKGCLPTLKLFLSNGINVCSVMFKIEMLTVSQILKKFQVVTRYIQNVCNYSKVSKDNLLILQLPGMRGILESILLKVKNIILQNNCSDAFFMGSMKNKDHHGEVIPTQESVDEVATEENEAEEMEVEDDDHNSTGSSSQSRISRTQHTTGSMSDYC